MYVALACAYAKYLSRSVDIYEYVLNYIISLWSHVFKCVYEFIFVILFPCVCNVLRIQASGLNSCSILVGQNVVYSGTLVAFLSIETL